MHGLTPEQFEEGLLGEFGSGMNSRYGAVIVEGGLWQAALDLAFHPDPRAAFRASWALEWAYFHHKDEFTPYIPAFLDNFCRADNGSVHRHYAKILFDMMKRGIVTLDEERGQQVAEKSFDLLIDPGTKVAVKVWAMEILLLLSVRLAWVEESLADVVRQQLAGEHSAGMANRGRKILKRLSKRERP